jgi:hypothetical protein
LELKGEHRLLVYAPNVNLLDENVTTHKEHKGTPSDAIEKVGTELNAEKTKLNAHVPLLEFRTKL